MLSLITRLFAISYLILQLLSRCRCHPELTKLSKKYTYIALVQDFTSSISEI